MHYWLRLMLWDYPHIPHEKDLETMKRYLDKQEDQSVL